MIQQVSVAVRRGAQLFEKLGYERNVVSIDSRESFEPRSIVLMVRGRMEAFGDAQLRKGPVTDLTRHHKRRNTGDVGLKGHGHQIEHEFGVLLMIVRYASGGAGHDRVR